MVEKYRLLFFRYLYEKLNLNEVELFLKENKIENIVKEELMCDEEIMCRHYSKYFYLLNTIDFSMLTFEELKYLNSIDETNNVDNQIVEFLERTYSKVFFNNRIDISKYYGPHLERYYVSGDYIVLGLKYDELGFASGKMKTRKEIEDNDDIINDVIRRIESNTNFKVRIIRYNELHKSISKE